MFDIASIGKYLPSVAKPVAKLSFREKLKWTAIILIAYYIIGSVTVFGVKPVVSQEANFLEIVFGSKFGSLITLGIGPIVTASIILQLLVGSKILGWDMHSEEGKAKFASTQKILAIAFSFFEAIAYVSAGAIAPTEPLLAPLVILQLAAGGIIIMFMDEVITKWGLGSGISLFIAAGVSKTMVLSIFSPLDTAGKLIFAGGDAGSVVGIIWKFIVQLGAGNPLTAFESTLPLVATLLVLAIVLYAQSMKIEIPMAFSLPFGKFGARRWSLKFIYASNIPVILTAAVLANVQVLGGIMSAGGSTFLGEYDTNRQPVKGISFAYLLSNPRIPSLMIVSVFAGIFMLAFALLASRIWKKYVIRSSIAGGIIGGLIGTIVLGLIGFPMLDEVDLVHLAVYMLIMIVGSIIFSMFWVNTAGMDAHTVAEQFKAANVMIPGFRRDPRIIEGVLQKYIPALAVLGGAFVGFLAGFADLTSAIGTGTGILLTVMILDQLWNDHILKNHADELPEFVKKITKAG